MGLTHRVEIELEPLFMADFFLSYASEDHGDAETLFGYLSLVWDIWWDDKATGQASKVIDAEISKTRGMIALVSSSSCQKDWTLGEWGRARSDGIDLIPVVLDGSDIPVPFNGLFKVSFLGWGGNPQHKGYLQLARKLETLVPRRRSPPPLKSLHGGQVRLPCLFQSMSTYETRLMPKDALKVALQTPHVLLSAYDSVSQEGLLPLMQDYQDNGGFILLDSGGFEAGRRGDKEWAPDHLWHNWEQTPHDWAFCYDNPSLEEKILTEAAEIIEKTVKTVNEDQKHARNDASTILPLVHMPRTGPDGPYRHELAADVIFGVAEAMQPALIGIPERELGNGVIERAKTIQSIRKRLSELSYYQPIHILGTGAPWTIALFAAAGADTFDGLEWCRQVVDQTTWRLSHFHDFDLFKHQSWRSGNTQDLPIHIALAADAQRDPDEDYRVKVVLHNLSCYTEFVDKLRYRAETGNFAAMLTGFLQSEYLRELESQMPELLQ